MSQHTPQDAQERIKQAQARARSQRLARTARAVNPQGVQLQGTSARFRDADPPEEKVGLGRMFLENLNPVQIVKGVARGVIGAVDELGDFATTIVGGAAKITGVGEAFGGEDFLDWWEQDDDDRNALHIGKDIIAAPTSILGGLAEGITQIGIGMIGVGKFAKLAKLGKITKLGKGTTGLITRELARGAAADAIFFDAHEARMANLLQNGPEWLQNPAIDFLAAKDSDTEAEGRFKNALEGLILGGAIGTMLSGLKVWRASAKGNKGAAIEAAKEFKPAAVQNEGIVKLPNGTFRLARKTGDDLLRDDSLLKEVRNDDPALKGLDVIDDGTDGVRTFEFKVGEVDFRLTSRLDPDGLLVVEALGRFDGRNIDLTGTEGIDSVGRSNLRTIGVELAAEYPTAVNIQFTKVNIAQGKPAVTVIKPLKKFRQELFASEGDAATEALAMAEGRASRKIDVDGLSKESEGSARELANAYEANRSRATIRKAETAWIKANRTNIGAGKSNVRKQIAALARILEPGTKGSARVMQDLADDSLQIIKGDQMEGLLDEGFAGLDELAVRRSAGLVMQSLGEDIARYSIRLNVGQSNMAYVQMARAMDQLMHVEEILTGRPAVFVERAKKFFDAGRQTNPDIQGAHANLDAVPEGKFKSEGEAEAALRQGADDPNAPKIDGEDAPPVKAETGDAGPGKPGEEAAPIEGVVPEVAGRIPEEAFIRGNAGVSPGPRSIRNLSKREIQDLGRHVALADGDPRAILISVKVARLAAQTTKGGKSLKQAFIRWRLSAMLSGVGTQMVNTVSTAAQSLLKPAELMIGGTIRADPRVVNEGYEQIIGLGTEMGDAWTAMRKAWKNKRGALDAQFMTREIDVGRFTGMLSVANVPMDFLTTSDEFFKVLNYRSRVRSKSLSSSVAAGLDPQATAKRLVDDLEASIAADGRGLNTDAIEYSRSATFTDELTGTVKRIAGALQSDDDLLGTAGQLFVPFIRTPHNVMVNIIHRTPGLQLVSKTLRADLQAGGSRAASATGKMVTAAALTGSAGILVAQGRITGGGPQHPLVRRRWLDAGFRPFTIRAPNPVGDGEILINYNRLSSLFGPMAMVADIWSASGDIKNSETAIQALSGVSASMLNYVSDNSWVGNAGEMMQVLFNGDAPAIRNFVESVAIGMAMPKAISQFTAWDDNMREADGFVQNLMKQTPGLSQNLPPRRNIFREPVMKAAGAFDRAFNPFTQVGPTEDNDLALTLFRLGKQMALPPHLRFNGRLDLKDEDKFGNDTGTSPYEFLLDKTANPGGSTPSLKAALRRLIKSSAWDKLPEGSEDFPGGPRYEAAARLIKTYQDLANVQMLGRFPAVFRAQTQEQLLRSVGRFGGRPATDALQESFKRLNP